MELSESLEKSRLNSSKESSSRQEAVMLLEVDSRKKTMWVRRLSNREPKDLLMPIVDKKKRVVARLKGKRKMSAV
jgi:hypothetical protein